MEMIKHYSKNAEQWLAHLLQTQTARRIMSLLIVLLGLVFVVKGVHTARFWSVSISKMQEQFIPTGWAEELTGANVALQLVIGLGLVVSLWFGKIRSGTLAAACLLLFGYAAYARIVQIKQLVAEPPCACIGWWDGMSWSSVLRTNIILLLVATTIWLTYPKKERRSIFTV